MVESGYRSKFYWLTIITKKTHQQFPGERKMGANWSSISDYVFKVFVFRMIYLWLEFSLKSLNNVVKSDGKHSKIILIKVMHWKKHNSNLIIIISNIISEKTNNWRGENGEAVGFGNKLCFFTCMMSYRSLT